MLTMWQWWSSRSMSAAGHDVVAEDLAPLLEALVGGEHGGGSARSGGLMSWKKCMAPVAGDRQVADLVDHEDRTGA
jgi:hypothetical protein